MHDHNQAFDRYFSRDGSSMPPLERTANLIEMLRGKPSPHGHQAVQDARAILSSLDEIDVLGEQQAAKSKRKRRKKPAAEQRLEERVNQLRDMARTLIAVVSSAADRAAQAEALALAHVDGVRRVLAGYETGNASLDTVLMRLHAERGALAGVVAVVQARSECNIAVDPLLRERLLTCVTQCDPLTIDAPNRHTRGMQAVREMMTNANDGGRGFTAIDSSRG